MLTTSLAVHAQALTSVRKTHATPTRARATVDAGTRAVWLVEAASRRQSRKSLANYLGAVWSRFMVWRMRRATRLILNALSDRMLRDIGVRRGDIDSLVQGIDWRMLRWHF